MPRYTVRVEGHLTVPDTSRQSCGNIASLERSSVGGIREMSTRSMYAWPSQMSTIPSRERMTDDLPQPGRPQIPTYSQTYVHGFHSIPTLHDSVLMHSTLHHLCHHFGAVCKPTTFISLQFWLAVQWQQCLLFLFLIYHYVILSTCHLYCFNPGAKMITMVQWCVQTSFNRWQHVCVMMTEPKRHAYTTVSSFQHNI